MKVEGEGETDFQLNIDIPFRTKLGLISSRPRQAFLRNTSFFLELKDFSVFNTDKTVSDSSKVLKSVLQDKS